MKKRLLAVVMAMVTAVTMFVLPASAANKWDGYIKITSVETLKRMEGSSVKFYLANDIDLSNYGLWTPIKDFSGTLDGNGKYIKNLTSTTGGLFNNTFNATVKNLGLYNVKNSSQNGAGFVANTAENSVFENIFVKEKSAGLISSGFVGSDKFSSFKNCVNISVAANAISGRYKKDEYYINGDYMSSSFFYSASFENCISYGSTDRALTENLDSNMKSCFNIGKFDGEGAAMAWSATSKGFMVNCGYLKGDGIVDIANPDSNSLAQATGYTAAQLKNKALYKGYDFGKTWIIDPKINNGYPVLSVMLRTYGASKPAASVASGTTVKSGTKITLTAPAGTTIYYTVNGGKLTKYTNGIVITKSTTIKAQAYGGSYGGQVAAFTYKVQ